MRTVLSALGLVLALASSASAQVNDNGTPNAIGGYDAVAYFTDHAAVRGAAEHAFDWHGGHWLFASEEHRALFAASPARYAPAYGGYCAFAAADGRLARIDPQAWHVEGGRLFLNYSLDVRRQWLADRAHFIEQADRRWPELSRQAH